MAWAIAGGKDRPSVRTLRASNPGFTFHSAPSVRSISPAPTSSTSVNAISAATSALCAPCRAPVFPRPPSFTNSCKSWRAVRNAGASPKQIPASREMAAAKISAWPSTPTSEARGKVTGSKRNAACVPSAASTTPNPPPIAAIKMLSVKSWRMIRFCPAPSAARIANSWARALERASSRFATFTQAINSTNPTAPNRTPKTGCTDPNIRWRKGISVAPIPWSVSGYAWARSRVTRSISARACSILTPAFNRPIPPTPRPAPRSTARWARKFRSCAACPASRNFPEPRRRSCARRRRVSGSSPARPVSRLICVSKNRR